MSFFTVLMMFMRSMLGFEMTNYAPRVGGGGGGIDPCRGQGCFSEEALMEQ